jgi:DNA-binding transcriptional ArsR family regulator
MPKYPKSAAEPNADLPARLVHALNHPIRIRILERLLREDSSASRLAEAFEMDVPTVSYHLCKVLFKECDLVTVVERHQRRGAQERVFALRREPYFEVVRFSTTLILALEAEGKDPRESSLCAWHSVAVDEQGQREINLAMEELAATVKAAGGRCANANADELRQLTVGTAAFEAAPLSGEGQSRSEAAAQT